ncbi:nuclear transcription factor Y subunit B-4 [Populus alba]|uniref:Transcription factor CBF/NF-Y/archaeal histone domain-containing protein n=1 Tax=Populus alba TaxID=43335 RepID=A0A4U5QW09_POPAL|nr:nuclear transcription factor Y subunit B-4-like [Populus alba]TKS13817.1 hypothetical protein D5086_0000050490 [Populus alba]
MDDEQDRLLPVANVGRMMKKILPPTAKISKEAKQTMQECATEFISFVTGEASDKCQKENRKTVNGDDICWALISLGFDDHAEAMVRYLHKYRGAERERSTNQHIASGTDQGEESNHESKQPIEAPNNGVGFRVLDKGNSSSFTNPS